MSEINKMVSSFNSYEEYTDWNEFNPVPAEEEMRPEPRLKLFKVTISEATKPKSPNHHEAFRRGGAVYMLGIDSESTISAAIDKLKPLCRITRDRITIIELKGPFGNGYVIGHSEY